MDQFLEETLISPAWWFTAIFVGIAISIVGNKLTDPISNFLGRLYQSIRERNAAYKRQFDEKVHRLINNPEVEMIVRLERNYYQNKVSIQLALAAAFGGFGLAGAFAFTYLIGSFFWIASLLNSPDSSMSSLSQTELSWLFSPFIFLLFLGTMLFVTSVINSWKLGDLTTLLQEVDKRRKQANQQIY